MEYTRPLNQIPIISVKNFHTISENIKEQLIPHLFHYKKLHDETPSKQGPATSICVEYDSNGVLKDLYKKFHDVCLDIFGKFSLSEKNNNRICSLITNNSYWKFTPHHHIETCTLNGVYYLNIPKINGKYDGKLMILWNNKWNSYQPEPNELIIMPNFLVHDVSRHGSEEWRISINMEITTKETLDELVNN